MSTFVRQCRIVALGCVLGCGTVRDRPAPGVPRLFPAARIALAGTRVPLAACVRAPRAGAQVRFTANRLALVPGDAPCTEHAASDVSARIAALGCATVALCLPMTPSSVWVRASGEDALGAPVVIEGVAADDLEARVFPSELMFGPSGGAARVDTYVFTRGGAPVAGVDLVLSFSNFGLRSSETALRSDARGGASVTVEASSQGAICSTVVSATASSACATDTPVSPGKAVLNVRLAAPSITLFTPTEYAWTGARSHSMTILGTNFSDHPVVLVAGVEAKVLAATASRLDVAFADPARVGDAALTLVEVINQPSLQHCSRSGVNFVAPASSQR